MSRRKRKLKLTMSEREPDLSMLPRLKTPSAELLGHPDELFLHLTQWTCPHGGEAIYYGEMLTDLGFQPDPNGNWWLEVSKPDGDRSTTCFMCHLDTSGRDAVPIVRYIKNGVCATDGKSILGADDRAGLAIMLHLASKDVPGLYYCFVGEERGCIGSWAAAKAGHIPTHIQRAVSFDRAGKTDVITHQCGRQTCSTDFAWALSNTLNAYGLNYSPDPTGVYTDSNEFRAIIPECTNLSVGYYKQHSYAETQDLNFLAYLAEVCSEIDWEGLPTARTPSEGDDWGDYIDSEYDWRNTDDGKSYYYGEYGDWSWESRYGYSGSTSKGSGEGQVEKAYEAMERLFDDFCAGFSANPALVKKLLVGDKDEAANNVVLLLDDILFWLKDMKNDKA